MKEIQDMKDMTDEFCKCGKLYFNIEKATPQERIEHKLDDVTISPMPMRRTLVDIEAEQAALTADYQKEFNKVNELLGVITDKLREMDARLTAFEQKSQ